MDPAGNILISGRTGTDLDFGSGAMPFVIGGMNAYLGSFTSSGDSRWTKGFSLKSGDVGGIVADGLGRISVTGRFTTTVDFGGGPITSAGSSDIFLVQFTQ